MFKLVFQLICLGEFQILLIVEERLFSLIELHLVLLLFKSVNCIDLVLEVLAFCDNFLLTTDWLLFFIFDFKLVLRGPLPDLLFQIGCGLFLFFLLQMLANGTHAHLQVEEESRDDRRNIIEFLSVESEVLVVNAIFLFLGFPLGDEFFLRVPPMHHL